MPPPRLAPRPRPPSGLSSWPRPRRPTRRAQDRPRPAETAEPSRPRRKTSKVADLANRYRFAERYTADEKADGPGAGRARTGWGSSRSSRTRSSRPEGAPKRSESTRQTIFAERAGRGERRWAASASTSGPSSGSRPGPRTPRRTMGARPLEGATVLDTARGGRAPADPQPDRGPAADRVRIRGRSPARSSCPTWRRSCPRRRSGSATPGGSPQGGPGAARRARRPGRRAVGKLVELRKEVDGPGMVASIALAGKVAAARGRDGRQRRGPVHLPARAAGRRPRLGRQPPLPPRPGRGA